MGPIDEHRALEIVLSGLKQLRLAGLKHLCQKIMRLELMELKNESQSDGQNPQICGLSVLLYSFI